VALSWARSHSHRCCPCAYNEVKRVDAAPPFHIRPRSSNPARSRAHTSTTRARPTGGKTASARNARCQEIWQASSTYGGMIRYPPKLPTMCQNSKASKISCCPSILSRGHQKVPSTRLKPSVEGACNFQIHSPFLTPHRADPSHWELRACGLASPQITDFLHKLKETLPCINPPPS
jgi:hypothetical protein